MNKFFILILCSLFCSCYISRVDCYNYDVAKKETLVKHYCKIVTRGTLEFLSYENGYYRIYVYSYRLDIKNRTASCDLISDTRYKKDDLAKIGRERNWKTASMFRQLKSHDHLRCFSEDFLELSNEDKMKVLDSISKR